MGPGIALRLPQWPPPQLRALRARFAGLARSFHGGPGADGREEWRFVFEDGPEPYEVAVYFWSKNEEDPAYAAAFGWEPRGYAELYGFKSADMPRSVRALAMLAGEIAERLGGVVALEKAGPGGPSAPGREFVVEFGWEYAGEQAFYADAARYAWLQRQPGYEISGYPAQGGSGPYVAS